MILELTIENLLNSGCNEELANELFNTTGKYDLRCNNGNFFVSKLENIFYTGIDYDRKVYFNNGCIRFPYNSPDLAPEYFDLALVEFIRKQKAILGILFNEKQQFNKFISNEIKRNEQRIKSQKEYLEKMKHHKFENKEKDIQICEGYINYLKEKLINTENIISFIAPKEPQLLQNRYSKIFSNDIGFTIFSDMFKCYKDDKNTLANFSFLFYAMEKEFLVCSQTDFIHFLEREQYDIFIDKIDSRQAENIRKLKLYNAIRGKYIK